jgi:hypothetical protein
MAKILIAEDERDIRDLITFTLGFAGFEVVAAANGEEAVNLARQEIPDLILMDVRMPRMTGYEACAILKTDAKLKDPGRPAGRRCGLFVETVCPRSINGAYSGCSGETWQVIMKNYSKFKHCSHLNVWGEAIHIQNAVLP